MESGSRSGEEQQSRVGGSCVEASTLERKSCPIHFFFFFQVKRELAGVLIFESHAKGGTVCK